MAASTPPKTVENLVELLRWRAEVAPSGRGFRFLEGGEGQGEKLSFSDLDQRARAIAGQLSQVVKPGDRALLLYPPSLDYIEAFFGCLYAGVVAVPAYPPNPRRLQRTLPRLQAIVRDAGATVALSTTMIASMAGALGEQAPELASLTWLATDEIDTSEGRQFRPVELRPESVAFLQYTSGSTGSPKGVVLDHGTLLRNEELIQEAFQSREEHVGVNWLPLYHDMGLIGAVIQPVYCGCESVLMSPLDFLKHPPRWLQAISRFGGTVSTAPNFAYDLAVRKTPESLLEELDLSTWDIACNGAEPIRPETMEGFSAYFEPCGFDKRAFMPAYGLAEVGLIVSATPTGEEPRVLEVEGKEQVSCGRPLGDFEVQVVKMGTRRPVQEGDVGELWLRGGSVATGYWEKEKVNTEIFQAKLADGRGPFLRTGDLGVVIDGEVWVTGRLKDLIVIRGTNHYPQDIEATVEGVDDALRPGCGAAFSVQSESGKEVLVVVHEVSVDEVDDLEGLLAKIREAITTEHRVVPAEVVLIEARTIEKTSSGKIQRFAARQAYEADRLAVVARGKGQRARAAGVADGESEDSGSMESSERGEARSVIEEWLIASVAEKSGLEKADIDLKKPFSSFGVDSADAVGIVGELEQWLEVEISATALYDFPTISALAAHLSDDDEDVAAASRASGVVSGGSEEGALAIVGMACRLPAAGDLETFWELLMSQDDGIREVPEDRWKPQTFTDPEIAGFDTMATDRGGFLPDLAEFDATYFGISASEARAMDPQQRLVLQTAWHAIEDAGWTARGLAGSNTGVFVGQSGSDFARLYEGPPVRAGSGMAPSITANRLSYWLDLRGPSSVVDTACSSSLAALDQAMLNLRAGRCDQAIVGGVSVILSPDMSVAFSQARMLSSNGECRAFDAGADGYVRGEGCAIFVVKRLADARRDGDRIRAVIRGGAINQDGQTNGLTAPSGEAQRRVIEAALADSGVEAESIGVVEGHGTGTELGDAIEVRALNQVFDVGQGSGNTRWLGTVKAQIGHLEAAAGAAGVVKAALMVERGMVVGQVNFEVPNPACEFKKSAFSVPQKAQKWKGVREGKAARRAGVSSFGFGGTNAHFILEEPPVSREIPSREETGKNEPVLVGISAKSEERLTALAEDLVADDSLWTGAGALKNLGYSLGAHRDAGPVRFALVQEDGETAREVLREEFCGPGAKPQPTKAGGLKVAFAFSGQGTEYVDMGRRLREESPVFRRHFEEALAAVEDAGCEDIRQAFNGSGAEELMATTRIAQPALFVVEVALARTLMSWGLMPTVVLGHSVGEFAAAHISGELSLQGAAQLIVERGRQMQELDSGGAMAAVFEEWPKVQKTIRELDLKNVDLAAVNGERHLVISGDEQEVDRLTKGLDKRGVFVRKLSVPQGFHSRLMEPIQQGFVEVASRIRPKRRTIDFVSTLEGRLLENEERLDSTYWGRHLRETVRFSDAVQAASQKVDLFVEIGAKETLSAMMGRMDSRKSPAWEAPLRHAEDGLRRLMETAARLWTMGADIDPAVVNKGGTRVDLPRTRFMGVRLWPRDQDLRQVEPGENG